MTGLRKLTTGGLSHVEGQGMLCIICKNHGVVNPQNKTDKFTAVASDRFKSVATETHKKTGHHQSALEGEIVSRMSVEMLEKKETKCLF